jgi:hypothetical protein
MARRQNHYQGANAADGEDYPIDDELERRLRHATLRRRILSAQRRLLAALGEKRHLYLCLEELLGSRGDAREEAMFNLGFEHGLVQGRVDALATTVRHQAERGRVPASRLIRDAANAGFDPPRALVALLEVAWAMALGPREAPNRPRPRSRRPR